MSVLNCNLDYHFYAKADAAAFHKNFKPGRGKKFYDVVVHAVQSRPGKQLLFHVYTAFNANYSMIGLDDLYWKIPEKEAAEIPYDHRMLWDCFSENVSVITYNFLAGKRCLVLHKNKTNFPGNYYTTVYWYNNGFSEEPSQYKEGHLIFYDNGIIGCQPNNRILWEDPSFGTKPFPREKLSVVREIKSCEAVRTPWVSDDSDDFFYRLKNKQKKKPSKS